MPASRLAGADPVGNLNPRSQITFKMAVALIDPIESASFMRYIPDWVEVDNSLDPRAFSPDHSRAISIFTDVPIPTHPKITRATGISSLPTAQNQYLFLSLEIQRHIVELGAAAISPVHLFRTSGGEGHRPLLGAIFKVRYEIPDGLSREDIGANLGVLSEKRVPELRLEDGEMAPQ